MDSLKEKVKLYWENETCGIRYSEDSEDAKFYEEIRRIRYELEPYIENFAKFNQSKNLKVLEIGVGCGTDFSQWALNSNKPVGIDLSQQAIYHTKKRLGSMGIADSSYSLMVGDAENLPFGESEFDLVYSWGVLHHSPDTKKCFQEIYRVLKRGGVLRTMIYHEPSWVTIMLWLRYGFFAGKISTTQKEVAFKYLESPGTKIYTIYEATALVKSAGFVDINCSTKLSSGDTLLIKPSCKYRSFLYKVIWKIYPRWLVKLFGDSLGLVLLVEAKKP